MTCPECPPFRSNHKAAAQRYGALAEALRNMASNDLFEDPTYQKLKAQVKTARLDCQAAREAMRVHKEGHKTGPSPP
jgi:hypothetical protein